MGCIAVPVCGTVSSALLPPPPFSVWKTGWGFWPLCTMCGSYLGSCLVRDVLLHPTGQTNVISNPVQTCCLFHSTPLSRCRGNARTVGWLIALCLSRQSPLQAVSASNVQLKNMNKSLRIGIREQMVLNNVHAPLLPNLSVCLSVCLSVSLSHTHTHTHTHTRA